MDAGAVVVTATHALYVLVVLLIVVAAFLALRRMESGPRMLDRIVALDVFTAILIGGAALLSVWQRRTDLVPLMVALAITGFFGAVAMARFTTSDRTADKRILSRDELEAELAARAEEEDDDAPALFDPEEESEEEYYGIDEPHAPTDPSRPPTGPERALIAGQGEGHGPDPDSPVGSVSPGDSTNGTEGR